MRKRLLDRIADIIFGEWNDLNHEEKVATLERTVDALKQKPIITTKQVNTPQGKVYPVLVCDSKEYVCMKSNDAKCGGYCPQCMYGVVLR